MLMPERGGRRSQQVATCHWRSCPQSEVSGPPASAPAAGRPGHPILLSVCFLSAQMYEHLLEGLFPGTNETVFVGCPARTGFRRSSTQVLRAYCAVSPRAPRTGGPRDVSSCRLQGAAAPRCPQYLLSSCPSSPFLWFPVSPELSCHTALSFLSAHCPLGAGARPILSKRL